MFLNVLSKNNLFVPIFRLLTSTKITVLSLFTLSASAGDPEPLCPNVDLHQPTFANQHKQAQATFENTDHCKHKMLKVRFWACTKNLKPIIHSSLTVCAKCQVVGSLVFCLIDAGRCFSD